LAKVLNRIQAVRHERADTGNTYSATVEGHPDL